MSDAAKALAVLMEYADPEKNGVYLSVMALNAIDYMDERAASARDTIQALPESDSSSDQRLQGYVERLKSKILADLE